MKPKLAIVTQTHRPVDITMLLRADIEERDWTKVHVDGAKNPPLEIGDGPRRSWR